MPQLTTAGEVTSRFLNVQQIVDPMIRPWISNGFNETGLINFLMATGAISYTNKPQFRTYNLPMLAFIGSVASVGGSATVDGQTVYPITLSGDSHNTDSAGTRSPFVVGHEVLVDGQYKGTVLATNKTSNGAHVISVMFGSGVNMQSINPIGKPVVNLGNAQEEGRTRKQGMTYQMETFLNNIQSIGTDLDITGLALATEMNAAYKGSNKQGDLQMYRAYATAMLNLELVLLMSEGGDYDSPMIVNGAPAIKTLGLIPAIKQRGQVVDYSGRYDTMDDFDDLAQRARQSMSVSGYTMWMGFELERDVLAGLNSNILEKGDCDWTRMATPYDDMLANTLSMSRGDIVATRGAEFGLKSFTYLGVKFDFAPLHVFNHPEILSPSNASKRYSRDAIVIPTNKGFHGLRSGESVVGDTLTIKTMKQPGLDGKVRDMLFNVETRGRKETGRDAEEMDVISYAGGGWDNLRQCIYIDGGITG